MHERIHGLIAAVNTPFDAQGQLNLDTVDRQAERLLSDGVVGVFVGGTTGECHSLTVDERLQLAERWVQAAGEELRVVVHVGHNCQADAQTLAVQASELAADGIAAMAPFFFKPTAPAQLADFLAGIAECAPELPFYYYEIPQMTGVRLSNVELLREAARRIPQLAGLKFSNPDFVELQELLRLDDGRYEVLFGCDEALLPALALGVRGAVGSTYNFAAPLYLRMMDAFERGDWKTSRAEQARSVAAVRAITRHGFQGGAKAVMEMLGIDCGPVRPPLVNLTSQQRRELQSQLAGLGLLAGETASALADG